MNAEPEAILSPVISTGLAGEITWFSGGELDVRRGVSQHSHDRPLVTEQWRKATFLTGAAMFLRGDTWEKLGGFREDLFLYWEDADLSRRASTLDIPLYVLPNTLVWHQVGGSSSADTKSVLWYYYITRNRIVVCASSAFDGLLLVGIRGINSTAHHIYRAIREEGPTLRRIAAMGKGVCDGMRILRRRRRS